jgi:antitoxin component of RelBE/YafQ-DinJ toxin-antitoxin module
MMADHLSLYTNRLNRQVTIRLETVSLDYFKEIDQQLGIPYQNLINLFLRNCASQRRRPMVLWQQDAPKQET